MPMPLHKLEVRLYFLILVYSNLSHIFPYLVISVVGFKRKVENGGL